MAGRRANPLIPVSSCPRTACMSGCCARMFLNAVLLCKTTTRRCWAHSSPPWCLAWPPTCWCWWASCGAATWRGRPLWSAWRTVSPLWRAAAAPCLSGSLATPARHAAGANFAVLAAQAPSVCGRCGLSRCAPWLACHRSLPLPRPAGSAISSIDPVATLAVLAEVEVPPILYNLVFGESVLNE